MGNLIAAPKQENQTRQENLKIVQFPCVHDKPFIFNLGKNDLNIPIEDQEFLRDWFSNKIKCGFGYYLNADIEIIKTQIPGEEKYRIIKVHGKPAPNLRTEEKQISLL